MKMATGDAPIEMDADPAQIIKLPGIGGKPVKLNGFSDHVPMPAKVTEVD